MQTKQSNRATQTKSDSILNIIKASNRYTSRAQHRPEKGGQTQITVRASSARRSSLLIFTENR